MTNFTTIRHRIDRLRQLRAMEEDGTFDLLPKKEVIKLKLEIEKLEKFMGGIKDMKKMLPGALFIVDPPQGENCRCGSQEAGNSDRSYRGYQLRSR